jgi:hypothetical protein
VSNIAAEIAAKMIEENSKSYKIDSKTLSKANTNFPSKQLSISSSAMKVEAVKPLEDEPTP